METMQTIELQVYLLVFCLEALAAKSHILKWEGTKHDFTIEGKLSFLGLALFILEGHHPLHQ